MKGVPFVNRGCTKGVPILSKMVHKRVRVGPLGGVPLILNLVESGPLGPILYRFRALIAQTCKIWLFKVNDSINFFYELKITSPLEPTVFGQEL